MIIVTTTDLAVLRNFSNILVHLIKYSEYSEYCHTPLHIVWKISNLDPDILSIWQYIIDQLQIAFDAIQDLSKFFCCSDQPWLRLDIHLVSLASTQSSPSIWIDRLQTLIDRLPFLIHSPTERFNHPSSNSNNNNNSENHQNSFMTNLIDYHVHLGRIGRYESELEADLSYLIASYLHRTADSQPNVSSQSIANIQLSLLL